MQEEHQPNTFGDGVIRKSFIFGPLDGIDEWTSTPMVLDENEATFALNDDKTRTLFGVAPYGTRIEPQEQSMATIDAELTKETKRVRQIMNRTGKFTGIGSVVGGDLCIGIARRGFDDDVTELQATSLAQPEPSRLSLEIQNLQPPPLIKQPVESGDATVASTRNVDVLTGILTTKIIKQRLFPHARLIHFHALQRANPIIEQTRLIIVV